MYGRIPSENFKAAFHFGRRMAHGERDPAEVARSETEGLAGILRLHSRRKEENDEQSKSHARHCHRTAWIKLNLITMARTVFRVLIGLTLLAMTIARYSRGRLRPMLFLPFYYWFLVSVFVFAAFGLISAYHAFREPHNRRAYLLDIILAAAWVPYWFTNFR
jgi:hypothetical protein